MIDKRINYRYGGDTMGGPNDKSKSGPGPDDRGSPEQNRNQRAQVRAGQVRAVENLIDRPTFGFTDAARINLFNPRNIFSGITSLINPALGLATRGFNFLGDKLQGLRGYNPDGTPRTQEEYEDYMSQKSLQNRFDKLMDRKLTGKNYSEKNLQSLMDMGLTSSKNSLASALARDLQINPEMPQFATSYLGSLNKGITQLTPQPKPGINLNDYMGLEDRFNVPSAAPEDYDFFSNAMAEITDKDKQMMNTPVGQMMDYDTFKAISGNDTLTPQEFEQLKSQVG